MPRQSLFISNEKSPVRQSNRSGIAVCVRMFLVIELLLVVAGSMWNTSYIQTHKGVLLSYHVISVYYLVLGVLNVYFYEYIHYDGICCRVERLLLPFRRRPPIPGTVATYRTLTILFLVMGILFWQMIYAVTGIFGFSIR